MKKENIKNKKIWNYYQTHLRKAFENAHVRFNYLLKIIKKNKKSGKHLDIGLGDGYFLMISAQSGFKTCGIDIADESIAINQKRLKKNNIKAELKKGNINKIPYKNNFFDIISSSEVLEHLSNKDLNLGIKEINRCLKKKGLFIATVPADEILEDNYCYCPNCDAVFHKWGHQQSFNAKKLNKLLSPYFKQVKIYKRPTIQFNRNLIEKIKFYTRWIRSWISPKNLIGTYFIIALRPKKKGKKNEKEKII